MLARIAALLRIRPPVVDNRGLLWGSGADYPTLGDDGWQTGAIWCNTTGDTGTSLYVNEGDVASCNFVAVDTDVGTEAGAIEFDDDVTGPLISIDTTDPTNDSYTTPFIITGAYSSSADNAIVVSSTNTRPVSFLFEDSGDVLGGDIRAGLFRLLLTVDQTAACTINALRAQIKANNLVDITNAGAVVAPLTGYLELDGAGARALDGHIACVRAALETGAGAHTVSKYLAGFEATLNSSGTFVGGGITAAFLADISNGTSEWQFGTYLGLSAADVGHGCADAYLGMFIYTGTYASAADKGIKLSATNQRPVTFVFDDGGSVLGSGNYRAVLSRVYLAATQTGQVAIRAIRGQVKVADAIDVNIATNELNAINGVEGYIELSGSTAKTIGANTRIAAVHGLVEVNQDITLTGGGRIVGLFAELSQVTAKSVSGVGTTGVLVDRLDADHATNQALWTVGLEIADGACVTGIDIGTTVTGIDFTGVMDVSKGVNFSNATFVPESNRDNRAIEIGGRGADELVVDFAGGVGAEHFEPVQMNFNLTGIDPAGLSTINLIQIGLYHNTDDMANLRLKCADWWVEVNKNCTDVYCIQNEIKFGTGTVTVTGEVAVLGLVLDGGTAGITNSAWRVINCTLRGADTPANSAGIFINQEAGCGTVDAAIRIGAGATMTSAFRIGTPEYTLTPTHLFQFPADATTPIEAGDYGLHSGTKVRISVLVGGVQYYMLASTAPKSE